MNAAQKEEYRRRGYSEDYIRIRNHAEKHWPQWKIDYYNKYMAVGAHATKLQHDPSGDEEVSIDEL